MGAGRRAHESGYSGVSRIGRTHDPAGELRDGWHEYERGVIQALFLHRQSNGPLKRALGTVRWVMEYGGWR